MEVKVHSRTVPVVVWELLWWEKVEIKPGQTLAAQFREKGAVELGGLIPGGDRPRECRTGPFFCLSIDCPSGPLGKAAGKQDNDFSPRGRNRRLSKKENRVGADENREGERGGEGENGRIGQGTGVVVVVTSK